ncbi:right-handed parallel beta-helix repeat-containing protein [bacterium]|nr:right-handed parallel beta-helix repeat-containing protein [candidate division CSSED10-310 bacterium]
MKRVRITVWILMIFPPATVSGGIFRVGHGSGYDFNTITDALAVAGSGDTIQVAAGTYASNDPQYSETMPLVMKDGIALIRENPEILPVIDANDYGQVIRCVDLSSGAWIEGFKITGGAAYVTETNGGGMYVEKSTLSVVSCYFTDNQADKDGGGLYCDNATVSITDCRFESNRSRKGGGLQVDPNSVVSLSNCLITANQATNDGAGLSCALNSNVVISNCEISSNAATMSGGGIFCYEMKPFLSNCFVSGNSAGKKGGGVCINQSAFNAFQSVFIDNTAVEDGGAIALSYSTQVTVTECVITGNSTISSGGGVSSFDSELELLFSQVSDNSAGSVGGGLAIGSSQCAMAHCTISQNSGVNGAGMLCSDSTMTVYNTLFRANHAFEFGGAVHCTSALPEFLNCTFTENYAADGGGALCLSQAFPNLVNCILWNDGIDEIFRFTGTAYLTYCDIQGGWTGEGNFDVDPLFVTGPRGFYYLSQMAAGQANDSPCLDAGSTLALSLTFTVCGETFHMDELTTRTDHVMDTGQVDVGYHTDPVNGPCIERGCMVDMPSHDFGPGDTFYCNVKICNPDPINYQDIPVFAILDIYGLYYFAPSFTSFDYSEQDIYPGQTSVSVLPPFTWPAGTGSASGIVWYAGMTNHAMTELFGEFDMFTFGWHE